MYSYKYQPGEGPPNNFDEMDPSMYLPFTQPNGLPQESKLVTYMNHSAAPPAQTSGQNLIQAIGNLALEPSHCSYTVSTSIPTVTPSLNQSMGALGLDPSPCHFPNHNVSPSVATSIQNITQGMENFSFEPAHCHYMNHAVTAPIVNHTQSLTQAMGNMSIEHSPPMVNKIFYPQVLVNEFVPVNYYNPPPIIQEPPEPVPAPITVITGQKVHQKNVGGTTYFFSRPDMPPPPINMASNLVGPEVVCMGGASICPSAYMPQHCPEESTLGGLMQVKPGLASMYYTPEIIRSELYARNVDNNLELEKYSYSDLPNNIEMYSPLTPLEKDGTLSMVTFRGIHRGNNTYHAIRRIKDCAVYSTARLEKWKALESPNIVKLEEYFPSTAFNDHSLILIYAYHPHSVSLLNKYVCGGIGNSQPDSAGGYHDPFSSDPHAPRPYTHQKNAILRAVASGNLLPELVIWSVLFQLMYALYSIHGAGLSLGGLDPSKIIICGCRVRVAWGGYADVHGSSNDIIQSQQEDLVSIGHIAMSMATQSIHYDNVPATLDIIGRSYSTDFKKFVMYLLTPSPEQLSLDELMTAAGSKIFAQVDALERRVDALEGELCTELDNGRLLRILIKLGVINERPELNLDNTWSETGDRYMLKLFRDYLFHTVNENGRPWLDQSHVTNCLNHLDAGSDARVELMTRDEQSVIVVSYAELKHCLDQAFEELMQYSATPPS